MTPAGTATGAGVLLAQYLTGQGPQGPLQLPEQLDQLNWLDWDVGHPASAASRSSSRVGRADGIIAAISVSDRNSCAMPVYGPVPGFGCVTSGDIRTEVK
jgi:hypothetical protein